MYPGSTFSYASPTSDRDLIAMECESVFLFEDATLHSTATGLSLTEGTLRFDGESCIQSDATIKSEGIMVGNGIDVGCDTIVEVLEESILEIASGYFVYNNVD
jgi:hypothetical protein